MTNHNGRTALRLYLAVSLDLHSATGVPTRRGIRCVDSSEGLVQVGCSGEIRSQADILQAQFSQNLFQSTRYQSSQECPQSEGQIDGPTTIGTRTCTCSCCSCTFDANRSHNCEHTSTCDGSCTWVTLSICLSFFSFSFFFCFSLFLFAFCPPTRSPLFFVRETTGNCFDVEKETKLTEEKGSHIQGKGHCQKMTHQMTMNIIHLSQIMTFRHRRPGSPQQQAFWH
jgi:hypothetical protein